MALTNILLTCGSKRAISSPTIAPNLSRNAGYFFSFELLKSMDMYRLQVINCRSQINTPSIRRHCITMNWTNDESLVINSGDYRSRNFPSFTGETGKQSRSQPAHHCARAFHFMNIKITVINFFWWAGPTANVVIKTFVLIQMFVWYRNIFTSNSCCDFSDYV